MPYEPLTVEQIRKNIPALKSDANAMRIYGSKDREHLQQAYDGGDELTDPEHEWLTQFPRESDRKWEERKKRLRSGVNPCRLIPDKVTAAMTNGTIIITCEDAQKQEAVDDIYARAGWETKLRREVERLCSIFGTVAVAPFYNEATRQIDFWWSQVDTYYPVLQGRHVRNLDALFISRLASEFEGKSIKYQEFVDVWTPTERARLVRGVHGTLGDKIMQALRKMRGDDYQNLDEGNIINPFGTIPFAVFRARPSAKMQTWFALGDIHEAVKSLEFILEQINAMSEILRYQAAPLGVISGEVAEENMALGPDVLLALDPGGTFEWAATNVDWEALLEVLDKFYTYAFETEGLPIVVIRTMDQPESGVAVKIKMKPMQEITEERRKRHAEAEEHLWILTDMASQIYGDRYRAGGAYDKVFGWEEAQDYIAMMEDQVEVSHADDYNPVDEQEDLETIDLSQQLNLISPFEAWQRKHPSGTEEQWEEWLRKKKEQDDLMKEIDGEGEGIQLPSSGPVLDDEMVDREEDEAISQALMNARNDDGS
jgi:hypothetical protein